jgi:hypothetical protein
LELREGCTLQVSSAQLVGGGVLLIDKTPP